jgi:uncharacterized DUF497 family protein
MRFEWDEAKRGWNIEKHGIDFVRAQEVFDGRPVFTYASPHADETRFVTISLLLGRCCAVVWTWRGAGAVWLISVRRARHGEERAYRELHG